MRATGSYTFLQQTQQEEYVTEALIGLGALARACKETPSSMPLLRYYQSGAFKNEHHRKAVQHYDRALVKAQQTLKTTRPEKRVLAMLISGVLFHTFEWFHGNPGAVDQIVPLLMGLLRDEAWANFEPVQRVFKGAMFMSRSSLVFQSISPHFPTIQQHIWGKPDITTFQPPSAPGAAKGLPEFVAVWWRFLTYVTNLYIQPKCLKEGSRAQIASLLAATTSWKKEALSRAAASDTSLSIRLFSTMATIANQISQRINARSFSGSTEGTNGGRFVALGYPEYAALLDFYKMSRPLQVDCEYDLITEAMNPPALPTLVYVARRCAHPALRLEALELCRSLLRPVAAESIEATYMALKALAHVEGEALANRYAWTESRWNDGHTALSVTLAPADPAVDYALPVRHLVLSVSVYGV